ncbi:MFS transporter [Rhodobacter capsulatus]|jgi:MFS family permease|uniref:Major facilitator superfamily MFS_1 n=1 Tax=Rhodobacter capsulatus (strain ATCC BAA-309 / NBRC 16581 / SB1003) TaxID=272942 RepID=D5ALG2_RHOCB|nr:MFS transporter [Rhodobacter capsulatus]ADE84018.1 major facilitator superfamily MFS_1 [Rhodobacter capsulatus SB 1003]ETD03131.1 MFS transporter [Rhodobacter capsulatus DE442]ETD79401.1 MFS transporter [Rhodobacter capsulatus R121]ETE55191.1 MFS transporter [Rhodobacter capsulatus Y262]MDS0925614.1 MFS transporter [Rhodobacter capsulatus]
MTQTRLITPVLVGGAIILMLGFAIRASFGVFQIPIATEFGWPRAEFSLAIAIQNLAWGIGQPIFGAIAEKFGDRKAIVLGALMYALGLVLSAFATQPWQHDLLEIFVGFGIAGTGFGVILAVVGRAASDENRSLTLGIATAAGSAGQVFGAPVAEALLSQFPWQTVFVIFAVTILLALLALPLLRSPARTAHHGQTEPMGTVLKRALKDPSFTLIFLGFFSCGYQLAFITAHFPAMVTEMCGAVPPGSLLAAVGIESLSTLGAVAISLIGLANIAGTIFAGWAGRHYSKKYALAIIYLLRTIAAAAFILAPMTPATVLVFSLVMGALWLATVPLTSGLIADLYGLRYMGTLYGVVFFSHQLGAFLGVWLGGRLYDIAGDYTLVWWVGVGMGAFSALVHLPVKDRALQAQPA